MKLVLSDDVPLIDNYAQDVLGISKITLMSRAAEAVAEVVRSRIVRGASVVVLAGGGNNGGDGYGVAALLQGDYDVFVYDMFSSGQRSDEGKAHLAKAKEASVRIGAYTSSDEDLERITGAHCVIDAVFGTGFRGTMPEVLAPICQALDKAERPFVIAVDVPLGINADNGTVCSCALRADLTVVLSYLKVGLLSYPAREYLGEIVHEPLGLPYGVENAFCARNYLIDEDYARHHLPERASNTNKGSFGKLSIYAGSERYRGAASLALGAALRGGVGLCEYKGPKSLCDLLFTVYPEAIYRPLERPDELDRIVSGEHRFNATLVGCGSDTSALTEAIVERMLSIEGSPLILDADAINLLARKSDGGELLKGARRTVILTPHPLEFSRLSGISLEEVQNNRIDAAKHFAREHHVILVLKGAGTIVTDGETLFVNSTGSSALAKAGSGDALAGVLASLVAMGTPALVGAALAVYIHGLAADRLAAVYSTYGVTPSDLPLEMAKILAELQRKK